LAPLSRPRVDGDSLAGDKFIACALGLDHRPGEKIGGGHVARRG
jgi:hypothetical protein